MKPVNTGVTRIAEVVLLVMHSDMLVQTGVSMYAPSELWLMIYQGQPGPA
jgi:hypothetical protein